LHCSFLRICSEGSAMKTRCEVCFVCVCGCVFRLWVCCRWWFN
jgi:hypothetical protein